MRLVADTNVVVSGLLWLGKPGQILEAAANGKLTIYNSPALVAELSATLALPKLAQRVDRSGLTREELLARYLNIAILVQPEEVPRIVANDPDDDHVIACAIAANADLIVSGDNDLLAIKEYQGIHIVNAADALQHL